MRYPRILRVADLVRVPETVARSGVGRLPRGVVVATAELASGTLVTLELRRRWWDRRPRRQALAGLQELMDRVRILERTVVVAAAIRRDHQVLIAQRSHPAELAGRWEFPGGKVEKGETLPHALIRECREELGVRITVGAELARELLPDGAELVLFGCELDAGAQPLPLEHLQLRWVGAEQLGNLPILQTNRRFLPDVTRWL